MLPDYEKLGVFYLGRKHDQEKRTTTDEPLLYDAKDLCTHAVVVGMTGSGKTGLCLDLLEEAAIDGIPAIAIDPKGDIGNLLLNFPGLTPEEFRPWIDEGAARREGLTADEYAAKTSQRWRDGLQAWDQPIERVTRLRDAADFRIYTPASNAGHQLTVLRSLAAPSAEAAADGDLLRERVASATSGLLALLDVNSDPINSREHILVANLLHQAWSQGQSLTLADLFRGIRTPPFARVGILDLESFFPEAERAKLALRLNNLMASPAFAGWMEGEPLDIHRLLYTETGKPRVAVISIAHLSDAERMFFVTLLLNEILSWVRTQPGTSSLRAILYMDEVFGFFPPTANPPSKGPMLTLLKQARAYGLGVVLATQNPVDLDYKGLSNAGTWFLGRLQTERDKMRVLEGLEGASAQAGSAFDKQAMERTLAGLGSRVFLMNNVHDDVPVVFETRWALSYLRGPLTRDDIRRLKVTGSVSTTSPAKVVTEVAGSQSPPVAQPNSQPFAGPSWNSLRPAASGAAAASAVASSPIASSPTTFSGAAKNEVIDLQLASSNETTPSSASQIFVPNSIAQKYAEPVRMLRGSERLEYRAGVLAVLQMHYSKSTVGVDCWQRRMLLVSPEHCASGPVWEQSRELTEESLRLFEESAAGSTLAEPAADLIQEKLWASYGKQVKEHAYRSLPIKLLRHAPTKQSSQPGEDESKFRVRLRDALEEQRELEIAKLKKSYATKLATHQAKVKRAEEKVQKEREQFKGKTLDSAMSIGSSLIGALLGRKMASVQNVSRASTAMKSLGRAASEKSDIGRAESSLEELQTEFQELEQAMKDEIDAIGQRLDASKLELETIEIPPKKTDIGLDSLKLVWIPYAISSDGSASCLID